MKKFTEYKRRHEQRKQRYMMPRIPFDKYTNSRQADYDRPYSYSDRMGERIPPRVHPMRRTLIQCALSAVLVASCYWINGDGGSRYPSVKNSIQTAMTQEFRFASVSDWYEKHLGEPVGFLPSFQKKSPQTNNQEAEGKKNVNQSSFAEPVTGEVTSPYSSATKGVMVETVPHADVKAAKDGLVIFVGNKKGIGETVVIQHSNGDESWYGKLEKAKVNVYQEVNKGQKIGMTSGGTTKATFYFALKKGKDFVDPVQVMSFD